MTPVPKRKPVRDPKYLKWIRTQPCIVCGKEGETEAAHIRIGAHAGKGEKPGDDSCVPLCSDCHRWQHSEGEKQFWTCEAGPIIGNILQGWRRYEYAQYLEKGK